MRVVLISTYDLGRQPFGLASPVAWLRREGAEIRCLDLAVEPLDEAAVGAADLVAFFLPMHTATRIALRVAERVRALNPGAHLCFYGLYAAMNENLLRRQGAGTVLGGEFEEGLASLVRRLKSGASAAAQSEPVVSLARQRFLVPDRCELPELSRYAHLRLDGSPERVVGYTEATRGCKHRCRHCPIVPVYGGRFRVVQREVVLEDIRRQVAAGARHITFGDPDFFNGPTHAMAIVGALHHEFPGVSYDVTIKIEHLLEHSRLLPKLVETGCALVTSAVESIDDGVLARLDKGHTRADFERALALCRDMGLPLNATFVAFTPWTSVTGYQDLLEAIESLDLVEQVAPIQLAIRLLIPAGSKLLDLPDIATLAGAFDEQALVHPWRHPDARVDSLQAAAQSLVREAELAGRSRRAIFSRIWELAEGWLGARPSALGPTTQWTDRAPIPYLTEPWYC